MTTQLFGRSFEEIATIIARDAAMQELRQTKAFRLMELRGQHELATQRMVAARNEMHRLNAAIARLTKGTQA